MKKNLVIIFSIIVLGLMFLGTDFCLALNRPDNLQVPEDTIGEAKVILIWEWKEGDGTLKQFKLLFQEQGSILLTWTAKYPIADVADDDTVTYSLTGLSEGATYDWRVMAEAENPAYDSGYTDGPEFTTITQAPPPPPPEENGGNDFLQNMELKNPLSQDTLWGAVDAVLNFLILASFVIVPALIIYAGFLIIFAGGDETKIKRGKDIIFWTIIAVAIILFAKGLPAIVKGVFIS